MALSSPTPTGRGPALNAERCEFESRGEDSCAPSPTAEAAGLGPVQCGFESRGAHYAEVV